MGIAWYILLFLIIFGLGSVENRFELCPRKTHLPLQCMGFLMMFGMLAPNAEAKISMN